MLSKAMILAAGFGTRLKPLTEKYPKPLIKVNGVPMIEHVIRKLIKEGITTFVINTHYFSVMIEDFFSKNNFDADIKLIYEKEILGTGGGIKNAESFLKTDEHF